MPSKAIFSWGDEYAGKIRSICRVNRDLSLIMDPNIAEKKDALPDASQWDGWKTS